VLASPDSPPSPADAISLAGGRLGEVRRKPVAQRRNKQGGLDGVAASGTLDGDVGGSELGAIVVAVCAEPRGGLAGFVQVLVRLAAVVVPSGGDGGD
jgi:hypothetical protein